MNITVLIRFFLNIARWDFDYVGSQLAVFDYVGSQVVDPGGWGSWPPKICRRGQSMFWPPENVIFFHSKLLLYNCKFHNIKDEHLDIITSLILLNLAMLPSYVWSATSRGCPPIDAFAATLSVHYRGSRQNSKTWVQVTRRRQSVASWRHKLHEIDHKSRLICCVSHSYSSGGSPGA